jgi:hypothetical protein
MCIQAQFDIGGKAEPAFANQDGDGSEAAAYAPQSPPQTMLPLPRFA